MYLREVRSGFDRAHDSMGLASRTASAMQRGQKTETDPPGKTAGGAIGGAMGGAAAGATIGAEIGASGGPYGAAIGAVLGAAAYMLS